MDDFLLFIFLSVTIGASLMLGSIIGAEKIYSCVNKKVCAQSCQTLNCYTTCRNLGAIDFERQVKYVGDKQ